MVYVECFYAVFICYLSTSLVTLKMVSFLLMEYDVDVEVTSLGL